MLLAYSMSPKKKKGRKENGPPTAKRNPAKINVRSTQNLQARPSSLNMAKLKPLKNIALGVQGRDSPHWLW
jgi:hypothetical protein